MTNFAFSQKLPSYFAFDVSTPAGAPDMVNPSAVYVDRRHGEVYVADTGNDRIVIFDRNGNYLFEFADHRHLQSPRLLAVDSLGRMLVQCERQLDRLQLFDYNGAFLKEIVLEDSRTDSAITISSFAMDDSDRVYVLSAIPAHIYVFTIDGVPVRDFEIFKEFKRPDERAQPILGTLAFANGMLVIPMPMISMLIAYDLEGTYVRMFGQAGGAPGTLSFPIAAASDGQEGMLVLDKHRATVLQYDAKGQFVTEVGGLGMGRGWFYHPVSLSIDGVGHCYVLQSFLNRVQAVNIPRSGKPQQGAQATSAPLEAASQTTK